MDITDNRLKTRYPVDMSFGGHEESSGVLTEFTKVGLTLGCFILVIVFLKLPNCLHKIYGAHRTTCFGKHGLNSVLFRPRHPTTYKYCFTNYLLVVKNVQTRFQYLNLPVEVLPSSVEMYAKPHIIVNSELKTIEELFLLDPGLNMINFIVEDNTNQFNLMMIGRHAEKLLGVSCQFVIIEEGHDDSFLLLSQHKKLVGTTKNFNCGLTNFDVYGLVEEQPLSSTTISFVEPCIPATNIKKQVVDAATSISFTPLECHTEEIQLPTSNRIVKRALFTESEPAKKQKLIFSYITQLQQYIHGDNMACRMIGAYLCNLVQRVNVAKKCILEHFWAWNG
ncbi:hypothetical protein DVH24_005534 [Malus domestica]|uniref:Uncharacterized protein n=1 Tax=Malus domestica TaxID=3750 RepID=A0A498IP81_MALDO|nr:hypothetical protein DVH24_005534 [Malus domestica]